MSETVVAKTDQAPTPPSKFSQGVAKGGMLAVSGQVAFNPSTGEIVSSDIAEQARQALRNVQSVLEAGGSTWEDVVMVRVFLTDTAHFAELNRVYDEWFAEHVPSGNYPARTTVYVGLPAGLLVEVDALASAG